MTVAADPNLGLRRVIISAPPRSGSTYVASVIARYLASDVIPEGQHFEAEHNLNAFMTDALRGHPFCFSFHMLPHPLNMFTARYERILLYAIWRNLGDMFVSFDEYAAQAQPISPVFYTADVGHYRSLTAEQRQLVYVDVMLPWCIRFYLMWRALNVELHPYEEMLADREAFFTRMLEPLVGEVDRPLLRESMDGRGPELDRLNVGVAGRSATILSDAAKREIEIRIMRHPDWEQLEILLWELPWDVPALARVHPFNGQVVAVSGDGKADFVSRGRRYPIDRSSWLESRTGERRRVKLVDAIELERLPLGAALF